MVATLAPEVEERRAVIPGVSLSSMSKLERKKFKFFGREGMAQDADKSAAYAEFMEALGAHFPTFRQGDKVMATVVAFDRPGVYLDIGGKSNAFLPKEEASLRALGAPEEIFAMGDKIQVQITAQSEDQNGQWTVSAKRIEIEKAWDKLVEMQTSDPTFDVEIKAINRGGAMVFAGDLGLTGFLPGSQLNGGHPTAEMIGRVVPCKLLEVDREANRFVVSNRKVVQEEVMAKLFRGSLVEGVVRTVKPFGAFVDIGVSALLHISEISASHVANIEEVLPVGTRIKAVIVNHDVEQQRTSLSTKVLEPNPGDMLVDRELVFASAEEYVVLYRQHLEEKRLAKAQRLEAKRLEEEQAAESILSDLGLPGATEGGGAGPGREDPGEEAGGDGEAAGLGAGGEVSPARPGAGDELPLIAKPIVAVVSG